MTKKLKFASLIGFAVILFVLGATMQGAHVNTDMSKSDQSAYMAYAKNMAETNLKYVGGRNRMPLYPALMSFFYQKGMSDEAFFERGKKVGIVLGLAGLVVIYFLFRKVARPMDALAATFVAMFTVFIFKSPYFQVSVLFYAVSFLLFYFLISLVQKPTIRIAAVAGVVGGIGHLTKASVLPAIVLVAFVLIVRGAVDFFGWYRKEKAAQEAGADARFVWKPFVCAVVFLFCFLLVVAPYIKTSKERFGRYFYNVNSTFYIWYDSWDEVKQGTRAYGDRFSWPDMPEEELPTFQKYVREHSLGQILWRFGYGGLLIVYVTSHSYGYAEFFIVYLFVMALLLIQNRRYWAQACKQKIHPSVFLFLLGYFGGYFLLNAWWSLPNNAGNRFILALFLPAMFLLLRALSLAQSHQQSITFFGRKVYASSLSPAVFLFLVIYLLITFPDRIMTMYGGG